MPEENRLMEEVIDSKARIASLEKTTERIEILLRDLQRSVNRIPWLIVGGIVGLVTLILRE